MTRKELMAKLDSHGAYIREFYHRYELSAPNAGQLIHVANVNITSWIIPRHQFKSLVKNNLIVKGTRFANGKIHNGWFSATNPLSVVRSKARPRRDAAKGQSKKGKQIS